MDTSSVCSCCPVCGLGKGGGPSNWLLMAPRIEMSSASTFTGTMRTNSLCSPKAVREV
jgi:hypothetical protein